MEPISSTFRSFRSRDLRWSYGAVGIIILIGVASRIFVKHGLSVYPFCFAAVASAVVNVSAARSGEVIDQTRATCASCGQEPDPSQLKRIASVVKNRDDYTRSRSVLTPQRATATVAQKEQALMARKRTRQNRG